MKIVDGKAVAETPEEEAALKALAEDHVSGLKAKNSELLGKLKEFDRYKDINPDEYRTLKEQADQIEADKLKAAGNWEAREKALLDAHAKEKEKLLTRLQADRQELERFLVDTTALTAINAENAYQGPMLPLIKTMTRVEEDNGRLVAKVLDEKGNPRIKADGTLFTIPDLVAEYKANPEYHGLFKFSGASGSGSQGGGGGGGTVPKSLADCKNDAEKIAYLQSKSAE